MVSSGAMMSSLSLYDDDEIEIKPWWHTFPWQDHVQQGKVCDYIAVSIGADALYDPMVLVIQDGWALQVTSTFCDARTSLDMIYKPLIDKARTKARDKCNRRSNEGFYELRQLETRQMAELKALQEMKDDLGENYKLGILRIRLPCQVKKQIHKREIRGEYGAGGRVLCIDLEVKKEESFEEAQVAALATDTSPV